MTWKNMAQICSIKNGVAGKMAKQQQWCDEDPDHPGIHELS